jgi:type IV fimbrial biogenesis protein FimT
MKRSGGFTLIELMVTLAVVAILATVAVPGFFDMIQNNRTTSQTNQLVSALNLARAEAIKRGVAVSVTAEEDGFAAGWSVNVTSDGNVIRVYDAMQGMTVNATANEVTFTPQGAIDGGGNVSITVSPASCGSVTVNRARQVTIGITGRVNVDRTDCL